MEDALKYVALVLDIVPRLIAAGINVKAFIDHQKSVIATWGKGGLPTPEQWSELNGINFIFSDQLHSDDK